MRIKLESRLGEKRKPKVGKHVKDGEDIQYLTQKKRESVQQK